MEATLATEWLERWEFVLVQCKQIVSIFDLRLYCNLSLQFKQLYTFIFVNKLQELVIQFEGVILLSYKLKQ